MATVLSDWFLGQVAPYPNPEEWRQHEVIGKDDVYRFVRLWLCEGIPFAFRDKPASYEFARERFAKLANVHPKLISMTGSGRIGFSMSGQKFGRPYDALSSDFDLFMVSEDWFDYLRRDAELFVARFNGGLARPSTPAEEKFWPENSRNLPEIISKGFIDHKKIPNYDKYPNVRELWRSCSAFSRVTSAALGVNAKVSVRVYRSWEVVERQIGGSLLKALNAAGFSVSAI